MGEQSTGAAGGFWRTLPGLFTAAGGLIAAISGLLVALNQSGLLGRLLPSSTGSSTPPQVVAAPTPKPSDQPVFMTRRLLAVDLAGKTAHELILMRNEIYARHGRRFNSADLQAYFGSQSWYQGHYSPDSFPEDLLTEVQKYNVGLISKAERSLPR
jgi:YARHG domain